MQPSNAVYFIILAFHTFPVISFITPYSKYCCGEPCKSCCQPNSPHSKGRDSCQRKAEHNTGSDLHDSADQRKCRITSPGKQPTQNSCYSKCHEEHSCNTDSPCGNFSHRAVIHENSHDSSSTNPCTKQPESRYNSADTQNRPQCLPNPLWLLGSNILSSIGCHSRSQRGVYLLYQDFHLCCCCKCTNYRSTKLIYCSLEHHAGQINQRELKSGR